MRSPILPGEEAVVEFDVRPGMEAAFEGRVIHPVLATWWLVHYMELAARRVLEPHLEPDEEGAGIGVNVRHLGPAPVGSHVVVRARATECDGRKLVCEVEASCEHGPVGRGTVYQAVWPRADLRERMLRRTETTDR